MLVSQVLHEAHERLTKYGWTRSHLGNKRVGYCTVGSITGGRSIHSVYNAATTTHAVREVRRTFLWRSPLSVILSIEIWNDMPWRRKRTVQARIRKAERQALRAERRAEQKAAKERQPVIVIDEAVPFEALQHQLRTYVPTRPAPNAPRPQGPRPDPKKEVVSVS